MATERDKKRQEFRVSRETGETGHWQKMSPGMLPRFKETFGLVRKDQMGSMQWVTPKHDTSMFGLMAQTDESPIQVFVWRKGYFPAFELFLDTLMGEWAVEMKVPKPDYRIMDYDKDIFLSTDDKIMIPAKMAKAFKPDDQPFLRLTFFIAHEFAHWMVIVRHESMDYVDEEKFANKSAEEISGIAWEDALVSMHDILPEMFKMKAEGRSLDQAIQEVKAAKEKGEYLAKTFPLASIKANPTVIGKYPDMERAHHSSQAEDLEEKPMDIAEARKEIRRQLTKSEKSKRLEKTVYTSVVSFLKEHFPQFNNYPEVVMVGDKDFYELYEYLSGELPKNVQIDGFYNYELNWLVFRGEPEKRAILHELAHWMQFQRFGEEWFDAPTNIREMERDAQEVEDKYGESFLYLPTTLEAYPEEMEPAIIGKYPDMERAKKYTERVPLPPGTPVPVLKGTEPTAKPPRELTMDEYRRLWRPKGWNIIFIGPTETWRQEWGIWEAIREIVQNALDETEAYEWGYDQMGLYIKDKGRGIGVSDFLLGPPKLKPEYARGKYGEGMKIGALALVREGYPVFVETVGRELWVVFLEQEANGKVKSLAALWRPGGTKEGTTWHIVNYRADAFSDRFAVNLPQSDIIARVPSLVKEPKQRYNELIVHDFTKLGGFRGLTGTGVSRIFARDIYMRNINSPYSYNLWSFELAPDRHAPKDETHMWTDVGRVWANVSQVEHLKVFLQMVCDPPRLQTTESNNVQFSWMGEDPVSGQPYFSRITSNKAAWNQAWEKVFGDSAVVRTDDRWDGTVKHLGYSSVSLQWQVRDALDSVIKSDKQLIAESQERLREVSIIPDEQLTPQALASLKLARMITEEVRFYAGGKLGGIHAAIIPPASDRVRTAGLYGRSTQEIFISADMLEHGRQTVDTVIHELAHHSSGAEDLEEKHAAAMTALAGRVVEKTAAGAFDKYLAEPFRW